MTTVVASLNQALRRSLAASLEVMVLGEDVLDPYGGAFKVTQGLSSAYPQRVLTTPVSEAGIVGLGVGMALRGLRPVVEIMFGDFLMLAGDALVNHAAKFRWVSNDRARVPLVVRTPMGGRRGYGPTHSQSLEKHLMGAAGLRTVAASALLDPGPMLEAAILGDDDPTLFVEHKLLYAQEIGASLDGGDYLVESAGERYPWLTVRLAGAPAPRLTVASYGFTAGLALEAIRRLAYEHEVFAELVAFTQLIPLRLERLAQSVRQTRALLTLEEGSGVLGWGSEVVSAMLEELGPVFRARRVSARPLPIPASLPLEQAVLPQVDDLMRAALLLNERDRGGPTRRSNG
jgi:pyruvate/2-oxoglutarate/acetoin dehydrogenase E1 component